MTTLIGVGPGHPLAWQVTFDKINKGAPDWQPFGPVPSPLRGLNRTHRLATESHLDPEARREAGLRHSGRAGRSG